MARVVAQILHPAPESGAGPLVRALETVRAENADRQAASFRSAGAVAWIDNGGAAHTFAERVRALIDREAPDGVVLLGSGSIPLASSADRRAFVDVAAGPTGHALANSRFSADAIAVAGASVLAGIPDLASDNGLPRWLAAAGLTVRDLIGRWRLQVDLDSPLDALLVVPRRTARHLDRAAVDTAPVRRALGRVGAVARDPAAELIVAGRTSSAALRWLERSTASRTRALVEERGFRTRTDAQRPVRSSLGLVLDRDGPEALGPRLAELGDGALVDSRVLIAHRFGADERAWPHPEDRFASDLLLPERIEDPWLRALTRSARDASIPIVLGGHTLVGPGVRLAVGRSDRWT